MPSRYFKEDEEVIPDDQLEQKMSILVGGYERGTRTDIFRRPRTFCGKRETSTFSASNGNKL
jgi:hypothetical protein